MPAKKAIIPSLQKKNVEREGVVISERLNTSVNLGSQFNFKELNKNKNGTSPVRYKRPPAEAAPEGKKAEESVMNESTMHNANMIGSKGLVQSLTE